MLNFFNSFVVPGVDNVTIFHDDQDPRQFYMLPEFPSIKKAPDGGPMFTLVIFARDFHLMKDAAQGRSPSRLRARCSRSGRASKATSASCITRAWTLTSGRYLSGQRS